MASTAIADYWGYLVKPDKNPTPVLEQLLLSIANYINRHVAPWDTQCLTPNKLAAFYRLVGGDYDPLFLETPQASLSFIYQSLGCYHTLQPERDPFAAPSIPALTPQGFVRWQTVQLLLEPKEHVPFLQEAVKRFEITNPADGNRPFPSLLPKEALPCEPDVEMTEWHDIVSQKLLLEARASQVRSAAPLRPDSSIALNNGEPNSSVTSSIDERSIVGAAGYLPDPRFSSHSHNDIHILPRVIPPHRPEDSRPLEQRRGTTLPPPNPFTFSRDGLTPAGFSTPTNHPSSTHTRPGPRPHIHSASTSSTASSSSSSSSLTTDSVPNSPILHSPTSPFLRRHSSAFLSSSAPNHNLPTPYRPHHDHHDHHDHHHSPNKHHPPGSQSSYFPPTQPRPNARGLNVRWRETNCVFQLPGSVRSTPGEEEPPRGVRLAPGGEWGGREVDIRRRRSMETGEWGRGPGREHGWERDGEWKRASRDTARDANVELTSGRRERLRPESPIRGVGGRRYVYG